VRVSERRAGSPQASAVIWRWRGDPAAQRPAPGRARLHGALQALAGAAVGAIFFLFWSRKVAAVAFAMSAFVGLSALLSPTGFYPRLRRFFDATGHAVGVVVTWIVMVPIFYLFFFPFGVLMRRGRNDRMRRYYETDAPTYWEPHAAMQTSSRERQY
jgi:hypothetical protein